MKEALEKIAKILESDTCFDADCINGGMTKGTEREKDMARVIIDIYRIVHPLTSNCCKKK